ncbi:MAG: NAD(P)/FAD-dependent oxidoreductase [Rhodospirillaceae bacterium]|nr:NAD(P)/FAD-dependent oxidoreductase [Rhodospirillaceae bacterium]MDD9917575.1 NAD(P)/FAD-dependent oxidoreductase [Rhodospirillaceae bacterium]
MSVQQFDVVIVGAGFAGMYLLHRLRPLGISARVVEAGTDVGGTWYWNRYPGARVDIESMQYSYQFDEALQQEWRWTEKYAPQPELLEYARHVADRFDLRRDIQFETRIASAVYDARAQRWALTAEDGSAFDAQFVVMATGCLSKPNWPHIDGIGSFAGPTYHTAMWPRETVDFTGQRVAVIGTGSSGIQSIPVIAEKAKQLTVFQRTANYAIPAHNSPLDRDYEEWVKGHYAEFRAQAKQTPPGIYGRFRVGKALEATAEERQAEYEERWKAGGLAFMGAYGDLMLSKEANDTAAEFVRSKIREIVDDPATAESLCPKNIIGGKRLCVDTNYYATYNKPHVRLVDVRDNPIEAITPTGVRVHGEDFEVDALVFATGFDAMTGALTAVDIRGKEDASLRERWADGPISYLGLAMAGFPNLFTVTGPGSPSVFTNMIPTIEQHVDWITDCLAWMQDRNYTAIEAEHDAEQAWWEHHQEVATVGIKTTTDSWYLGANVHGKARVFMPYYGGFPDYCRKCEEVVADGYAGFAFG